MCLAGLPLTWVVTTDGKAAFRPVGWLLQTGARSWAGGLPNVSRSMTEGQARHLPPKGGERWGSAVSLSRV